MFQNWNILLVGVVSRGLFRHYINILVFEVDDGSLSNGFSLQKPLIVDGWTEATAQPQGDHFLSLLVSVEHDSALVVVVVVVPLSHELIRVFQEHSESFAGKA